MWKIAYTRGISIKTQKKRIDRNSGIFNISHFLNENRIYLRHDNTIGQ